MNSNAQNPAYKPSHADYRKPVTGAPGYEIERRLMGYTYGQSYQAAASPQYLWVLFLDGKRVDMSPRQRVLIAEARKDAYR